MAHQIGAPAGTAAAGPLVPSLAADLPGQAASFAGAELLIGAADWAVLTTTPLPAAVAGFVMPDILAPWIAGTAPVRPVRGDHDVFGDGTVMMLAMPGHTPGESVLLVNLPETGPVLLSGDVVHFEEQLALAGVPSFNSNRAGSLAAIDRMQRLVANLGATLVIQHDMRHIARLPAFPAAAR